MYWIGMRSTCFYTRRGAVAAAAWECFRRSWYFIIRSDETSIVAHDWFSRSGISMSLSLIHI